MFDPSTMTWTCHLCGVTRPDNKIGVVTHDRSAENGLPVGMLLENVRYCNDNAGCIEKSKTYNGFKADVPGD